MKKSLRKSRFVAAAVVATAGGLLMAPTVQAVPTGAFAGAFLESFEGLTPGPNNTVASGSYFEPGVIGAFTFASGATLTDPIPNPGINTGLVVGDFSFDVNATFGLGANGSISDAGDVPDGSAYMGLDSSAGPGPIEFTLPANAYRVGALVSGTPGTVTLEVLTAGGVLLESHSVATVGVASWPTNFLGIDIGNSDIGIVRFTGNLEVIDGLTWDTAQIVNAVPEPVSAGLGLMGLGALAGVTRRRGA